MVEYNVTFNQALESHQKHIKFRSYVNITDWIGKYQFGVKMGHLWVKMGQEAISSVTGLYDV